MHQSYNSQVCQRAVGIEHRAYKYYQVLLCYCCISEHRSRNGQAKAEQVRAHLSRDYAPRVIRRHDMREAHRVELAERIRRVDWGGRASPEGHPSQRCNLHDAGGIRST